MALSTSIKNLLFFILFIFFKSSRAMVTYNVVDLGADPKGITESTPAFNRAWSKACSSSEPAVIFVPQGTFLLRVTQFNGPCKNEAILIQIIGSLVAPTDYTVLGSSTSWIYIHRVNGVSIQGGNLDGKGKGLWDCKGSGRSCPLGSSNLGIFNSNNINITSLTSRDSQMFHIKIEASQNVKLERVTTIAPEKSPNTDGIHLQASSYVSIFRSNFSTGDDCISVGPGTSSLWIENVSCGPGHGISIGSLGDKPEEEGVHNVTITAASFMGAQNGVRIKTFGKPSNAIVKDVIFQHATMNNVHNPIIIDQNYCPRGQGCGGQPSGIQISNVTYNDIHGSSASKVAVKFDCSPKKPCSGLMLGNINLAYNGNTAEASCANAFGKTFGSVNPASCLKG